MKNYNVAVMVLDVSGEFTQELYSGVTSYFRDKNVNTYLCQVKMPETPYGIFEYQYWAATSLLSSKSFDAVIVVSSFFISSMTVAQFSEYLRRFFKIPVISLGTELILENSCFLKSDCKPAFREIFNHLVEKHNCKKIAFLSANNTKSEEARSRFEAYCEMLEENNMEYDADLVFDGNFTLNSAELAMSVFKKKGDIPFDAIMCANDTMAIGCYNQLSKIGVSIPEDVIVTGFDDSFQAQNVTPTMTTISQQIFNQGFISAELAYKAMTGEPYEKENYLPLKPIFRQSCGCVKKDDFETNYIDSDGRVVLQKKTVASKTLEEYTRSNKDRRNVYYLLDSLQVSENLSDLFLRFRQILFSVDIRRMALVLYDEPILNRKGDDFILPETAELVLVLDREHDTELINPGMKFNPAEQILPEDVLSLDTVPYILEPVFYGEKQYGYAVYKFSSDSLPLSSIYLKTLSNAIAGSYEFTKKQEENEKLSRMNEKLIMDNSNLNTTSKTDELTQIFNRRGFLFAGKQILDLSHSLINRGTVFFCDIDGLKKINDTYGHEAGDTCIKIVAQALKQTFSLNDVLGRLGGDEFAVISAELSVENFDDVYKQLLENCRILSQEKSCPFTVTVSLGCVEYTSRDTDLKELLARADADLYDEKRRKKTE